MNRRGRTITLSVAAAVVVVFGTTVTLGWHSIVEGWCLWKLEHGDVASRRAAVNRLGELRSVRAVPHLVRLLQSSEGIMVGEVTFESYVVTALVRIGQPSIPALLSAIKGQDRPLRAVQTLGLMGHNASAVLPELRRIEQDATDRELKYELSSAIGRIERGVNPASSKTARSLR